MGGGRNDIWKLDKGSGAARERPTMAKYIMALPTGDSIASVNNDINTIKYRLC